jgi:hypothetical protein
VWHIWGKTEIHTEFWWENLNGRPFGRHRSMWKDNIKMNFTDIEWQGMNWVKFAKGRGRWHASVKTTKNLQVT